MKKTMFLVAGLSVIVLAARLADAQTISSASHGGAQGMSAIDTDLAGRIRRSVVADRNLSTYAAKITIVAHDSSVRLSGLVQNEGEKAQIGVKAAAIAGQRHVVNDLQVMPTTTAGTELRDMIRQANEPRAAAPSVN